MSRNHPYRSLSLPSDAPIELRPSPGKGWGVFATKHIVRGAMILREKAIFVIRKPFEATTPRDVETAIQGLAPRDRQQCLCLRYNGSMPFRHAQHAFSENCFHLSETPPIFGAFLLHPRFNHSCISNGKIPEPTGKFMTSFAIKDIMAGEEITVCYRRDFEYLTRQERHQELGFTCNCKACSPGTPFQHLSDIRRTFIRGLCYLMIGTDVNGQRQISAHPIIADAQLKKAAEEYSIKLSDRLIYTVLSMCLMEEEGLLDQYFKPMNDSMLFITTSFKTESNAEVAKLVVAQDTWLEKLRVALRLYGRKDAADNVAAALVRHLRASGHQG